MIGIKKGDNSMKSINKALIKLIILCLGVMYIFSSGIQEKMKAKVNEIINRPFIMIQQEFNSIFNRYLTDTNLILTI